MSGIVAVAFGVPSGGLSATKSPRFKLAIPACRSQYSYFGTNNLCSFTRVGRLLLPTTPTVVNINVVQTRASPRKINSHNKPQARCEPGFTKFKLSGYERYFPWLARAMAASADAMMTKITRLWVARPVKTIRLSGSAAIIWADRWKFRFLRAISRTNGDLAKANTSPSTIPPLKMLTKRTKTPRVRSALVTSISDATIKTQNSKQSLYDIQGVK